MSVHNSLRSLLDHFLDLLYPPLCFSCNSTLSPSESIICTSCKLDLPLLENPAVIEGIKNKLIDINPYYLHCHLYYQKGNVTQKLLHDFKYRGYEIIGLTLGRWLGENISFSVKSSNIDFMVPVPLHKSKMRTRGFNQSAVIARGVSDMTGLQVCEDVVVRISKNKSQTKKSRFGRMITVKDIFDVKSPDKIRGKHVLLVDDVITTGSTISACADKILGAGAKKISIVSLAAAK